MQKQHALTTTLLSQGQGEADPLGRTPSPPLNNCWPKGPRGGGGEFEGFLLGGPNMCVGGGGVPLLTKE